MTENKFTPPEWHLPVMFHLISFNRGFMKLAIIAYFRAKLAHSNESVYCTSIDKTLKCDSRGVG